MRTIEEYVSARVGHLVRVRRGAYRTVHTYETHPVRFRRPERGSGLVEVCCGMCGVPLRLRVHSVGRTVTARRRWLMMTAAGLLLGSVFGYGVVVGDPADSFWLESPARALTSVAGSVVGLGTFVAGVTGWLVDTGVRVKSRTEHGRSHDLLPAERRRPGPRGASRRADG